MPTLTREQDKSMRQPDMCSATRAFVKDGKVSRTLSFVVADHGYRYYAPELGRWTSRDPIEERGGLNVYWMIANIAVQGWDNLGLEDGATTAASGLLELNTSYQLTWQGNNIGTLKISKYEKTDTTLLTADDHFYGAKIKIEPSIEASKLKVPCILRWRQRVTATDQAGNFLTQAEGLGQGTVLNNVLDPIFGRGDKDWFWSDKERETKKIGPAELFEDWAKQRATAYLVNDVTKVTFAYTAELVAVTDINQANGGQVVVTITWGYWMTKGTPPNGVDPLIMTPPPAPNP